MNHARKLKCASLAAGGLMALAVGCAGFEPLRAQEVVQALPPREAAELNAALRRLAARPTDLDALVSAGEASLVLNDTGAAAGFFARAAAVSPADRRVLLGQARVALAQQRPVAALQGFSQAEKAGVRSLEMAADRALAYDLVGDNAAAQALYRSVLAADDDNSEVRRRLALSLAISGNRSEFERVLYPMLRDEDRAAYRTRAFGLAVLGRPDDAVAIADAMMPTDLALRMAPYLRYMPRLTKAQQAAAGNLGAFPAAAEIGRDSAEIAGYASAGARIAANASASLTPIGAPLGRRTQVTAPPVPARQATTAPTAARGSRATARAPAPTPSPAPSPARAVVVAEARPSAPAPSSPTEPSERLTLAEVFSDLKPASATQGAAPGAVDISRLAAAKPAPPPTAKQPTANPPAEKPKPKPKAEKPAEPARNWVQIGVGRNTGAFAFDWRKLAKQAEGALDDKGPWAAKYGATNRMLAGPYPSEATARAAIKRLKDKGIDALPFTSDEGEKVTKIG
jgi:tetratricopeptide (TPR) repeat protein